MASSDPARVIHVAQIPLSEIKEGQVLEGVVTRQMLVHGAQVDLGADFDGCVFVSSLTLLGINS